MNDSIVSSHTIHNYSYLLPKYCVNLTDTIVNIKDKWNVFLLEANNKKVNLAICIINHIQRKFIQDITIELTTNKLFLILHANSNISKNYILSSIYSTNSLLSKCHSHVVKVCVCESNKNNNYIKYILLIVSILFILTLLRLYAYKFPIKNISDPLSNLYLISMQNFKEK